MTPNHSLLAAVTELAKNAGDAILEVYDRDTGFSNTLKNDHSPLTEADLAAHRILVDGLQAMDASIPVLSEESALPPFSERQQWEQYWLIDPLDGTKEFIKRNGEFTVNIALIEAGVAILGVVHVPVKQITYTGGKGLVAIRIDQQGEHRIEARGLSSRLHYNRPIEVVASRSHGSEAVDQLLEKISQKFGSVQTKNLGSSLKLCMVAEGSADLYPRLALTSEWDTAAAQAVVEAAGGMVVDYDFKPLRYNSKEDILNPFFYVIADPEFDWKGLILG